MKKLARFLACSGVLATVALSAPGTALATSPPYGNDYRLQVPSLKPGEMISLGPYEKISDGNVQLTPDNKGVGDGPCFLLIDFYKKKPISDEKHIGNKPITLAAPAEAPRGTKLFDQVRNCGDSPTSPFVVWQTQ